MQEAPHTLTRMNKKKSTLGKAEHLRKKTKLFKISVGGVGGSLTHKKIAIRLILLGRVLQGTIQREREREEIGSHGHRS